MTVSRVHISNPLPVADQISILRPFLGIQFTHRRNSSFVQNHNRLRHPSAIASRPRRQVRILSRLSEGSSCSCSGLHRPRNRYQHGPWRTSRIPPHPGVSPVQGSACCLTNRPSGLRRDVQDRGSRTVPGYALLFTCARSIHGGSYRKSPSIAQLGSSRRFNGN